MKLELPFQLCVEIDCFLGWCGWREDNQTIGTKREVVFVTLDSCCNICTYIEREIKSQI
jgi:hypothetical protein